MRSSLGLRYAGYGHLHKDNVMLLKMCHGLITIMDWVSGDSLDIDVYVAKCWTLPSVCRTEPGPTAVSFKPNNVIFATRTKCNWVSVGNGANARELSDDL